MESNKFSIYYIERFKIVVVAGILTKSLNAQKTKYLKIELRRGFVALAKK